MTPTLYIFQTGPLFSVGDPTTRLAPGDGEYVEAVHTNGGLVGYGKIEKIVHE